jgi:DNA mismatch endonuclease, patch repair protein
VDVVDKATRSRYMAAVKPHGNRSTEAKILKILKEARLTGWRRQYPLPGTPDFCWPGKRVVLFVDGCFWHGCPHCYKLPKSNVRFWRQKVVDNRKRDRRVDRLLRHKGWTVLRVWECRITQARTLGRIRKSLFA